MDGTYKEESFLRNDASVSLFDDGYTRTSQKTIGQDMAASLMPRLLLVDEGDNPGSFTVGQWKVATFAGYTTDTTITLPSDAENGVVLGVSWAHTPASFATTLKLTTIESADTIQNPLAYDDVSTSLVLAIYSGTVLWIHKDNVWHVLSSSVEAAGLYAYASFKGVTVNGAATLRRSLNVASATRTAEGAYDIVLTMDQFSNGIFIPDVGRPTVEVFSGNLAAGDKAEAYFTDIAYPGTYSILCGTRDAAGDWTSDDSDKAEIVFRIGGYA